jgi:hypothetical protein
MTEFENLPRVSSGAQRMRRYRERRGRGLLCVTIQVRQAEISALIEQALLEPSQRQHPAAVAAALHRYLDLHPIRGPAVTRNANTVTCHTRTS